MAELTESKLLDDPKFQAILVELLEQLEAGAMVDRDSLTHQHPEYAEALAQFLDDRNALNEVVSGLSHIHPNSTNEFSAGDRIRYIGEYEILEEVARGGMGVVYRAKQNHLDRVVALKMILSGRLAGADDVERFQREAQAAGKLQHPNIVSIHEVGQQDNHHYFTMDFVDGQSLSEQVRDTPLPPRRTANLVMTIAEAVEFAHQQGIVHRDLKPANILLGESGEAKITDFGLAKVEQAAAGNRAELTTTGQILGTPSYMSPEQATGKLKEIGPASDIYSLGAILYFCLTGRAPFVAESPVETLQQVANNEPVSPRVLNNQVPIDLETICLKCLRKESAKRYETAQDLADDLQRFLDDRPITARRIGTIGKTTRWCRRNPAVAALLVLVGLSLTAGTTISTYLAISANKRATAEAEANQRAELERNNAIGLKKEADEARKKADQLRQEAVDLAKVADTKREEAQLAADAAEREREAAIEARALAVESQEQIRQQLYIAHMNQASAAWQQKNIALARELITHHVPKDGETDLREFEWYFLDGLLKTKQVIDTGNYIRRMAVSPDGRTFAVAHPDSLSLRQLPAGEEIARFEATSQEQGAKPIFSSDGRWLAFSGRENVAKLVDMETHKVVQTFPMAGSDRIRGLAFDHNSQFLATATRLDETSSQIECWDVRSAERTLTLKHPSQILTLAFRKDRAILVASDTNDKLTQWDILSGEQTKQWPCGRLTWVIEFSHDGKRVATGGQDVSVLDPETGKVLSNFGNVGGWIRDLDFHPNGVHLIGAGEGQDVFLWNTEKGSLVRSFTGHTARIQAAAYRPGFKQIISADEEGVTRVWDLERDQGSEFFTGGKNYPSKTVFAPDGKLFAASEWVPWETGQAGGVQIWKTGAKEPLVRLEGHQAGVAGIDFNHDGSQLVSASYDHRLLLWDVSTKQQILELKCDAPLHSVQFHPHDPVVAVGTTTGDVIVWHTERNELLFKLKLRDKKILTLDFSTDGEHLVVCDFDGFKVFQCESGDEVVARKVPSCATLAFRPDEKVLVCSSGKSLRVFETDTWTEVRKVAAHARRVRGLCFNSDGTRMATTGEEDSIKVWETDSFQTTLALQGNITKPQFSPDGSLLVRGFADGRLSVWKIETDENVQPVVDAQYLLKRGTNWAHHQHWKRALADFDRALETQPDPYAAMKAAQFALMAGDLDRHRELTNAAIAQLDENGIDDGPQVAGRWAGTAFLVPGFADDNAMLRTAAQQAWDELHDNPNGVSLLFCLMRNGEYEELVEKAVEFASWSKWGVYQGQKSLFLAIAYYKTDRIEEANAELFKGLNQLSNSLPRVGEGRSLRSPNSDWFITSIVIHREASECALEALNTAIKATPDDPELLWARATLHRHWQRWREAAADYQQLVDLDGEEFKYRRELAITALLSRRTMQYQQHCHELEKLLKVPDAVPHRYQVARLCALYTDAIEDEAYFLEQAELFKNASGWYKAIAGVGLLCRLKKYEEADAAWKVVVPNRKYWDQQCTSHYWRALIQAGLGNLEEAKRSFRYSNELMDRNYPPPGFVMKGELSSIEPLILREEARRVLEMPEKPIEKDQ